MANTISTLNMTKEEWLEKRHESIGASDSACILGLNPWKSPVDLYLEKINPTINKDSNLAMKLGLKLEPIIKDLLLEEHGMKVRNDNKIRVHPDEPWITANLDGIVVGEKVPIEYKTTTTWDGEIPTHYFTQLQHQMFVTGADYCYFAVLVLGYNKQFILEKYKRNDAFIGSLFFQMVGFWDRVEKKIPPEPWSTTDAQALYNDAVCDKSISADENVIKTLDELKLIQSEVKAHQFRERELKTELMKQMQDAEYILDDGGNKLISWKKSKPSTTFDKSTFKEDQPEMYEKYLKETDGSRRFLVKR